MGLWSKLSNTSWRPSSVKMLGSGGDLLKEHPHGKPVRKHSFGLDRGFHHVFEISKDFILTRRNDPNWQKICQMGWNYQLVVVCCWESFSNHFHEAFSWRILVSSNISNLPEGEGTKYHQMWLNDSKETTICVVTVALGRFTPCLSRKYMIHTLGGRNPKQPPGMYKTL